MNHANLLTSPHALEELLAKLRAQDLMPSSLRLIGLLGVGNNATVFSATIGDVYHVVKVYASRARMRTELRHVRRSLKSGQQLLIWEDEADGGAFSFFIIQLPPGRQFVSADLTPPRMDSLAEQLVELHRVQFNQTVSVAGLRKRLKQSSIALDQIADLGLNRTPYDQLFNRLKHILATEPSLFKVKKSRIHGDLWWPNIVATPDDAYLIDWDEVRRADPAEDLAKLRIEIWFARNSFPSRNFFWSASTHGSKVGDFMARLVAAQEVQLSDTVAERLKFYIPLYGLHQIAKLAIGASTTEPILRSSLYKLLAEDLLSLSENPLSPPPNLRATEYYDLVKRSRTRRLDGLADTVV